MDELIERLIGNAQTFDVNSEEAILMKQAAYAIAELRKQRDCVAIRLCEWCGVCPENRRNPFQCDDIAQL